MSDLLQVKKWLERSRRPNHAKSKSKNLWFPWCNVRRLRSFPGNREVAVNDLLPPSLPEGSSPNHPNDQWSTSINQPISDRWLAVKRGMGFEDIGGEEEDRQQCDGMQPIALGCKRKQLGVSWCFHGAWDMSKSGDAPHRKCFFSHSNLSNSQFDDIKAVDEFPPSETSRRNSLPSVELWSYLCPKLCKMDARAFALRRTTLFWGKFLLSWRTDPKIFRSGWEWNWFFGL